jgi:hypothetical protein
MGLRTTKNTVINHSVSGLTAGFRKVAGRRVLCAAFDLSLKNALFDLSQSFLICRKLRNPNRNAYFNDHRQRLCISGVGG